MKNAIPFLLVTGTSFCFLMTPNAAAIDVQSPDKSITLSLTMREGVPYYEVRRATDLVIAPSRLGVQLRNGPGFDKDLVIDSHQFTTVDETWRQVWGECKDVRDYHRQLVVTLAKKDKPSTRIEWVFRVFNDGVGFRYRIPKQEGLSDIELMNELTEFTMTDNHRCWWIPAYQYNRYEYRYTDSPLQKTEKVHTPITFKASDKLYISLHEAALTDFASMALHRRENNTFEADLVPWSDGVKVRGTLPIQSPWRTIQISETPGGLIESPLILNLNEPNKLDDVSWIKPGKYVGIWWEMHLGKATWGSGPKHGATNDNTKRYIDFAAEHGFDGVLVEGWNTGWDGNWIENGEKFNFTTAYPDFDIEMLAKYARDKGVRLIGHHETGGAVENYERQVEDAFKLYQRLGVRAVKTGYVAHAQNILRTDKDGTKHKEWHHGQYMVRHYRKIVELAAKYQIMLDVHEPIKATGIRRTYPNMMTREGACGQEFNAWGGEATQNKPDHTTILPFTRLLGGPMDFTPGIFGVTFGEYQPGNRVSTTVAKQLALYVILYSPLHMAADLPENYEKRLDVFQFIKDVPTDWAVTKVIDSQIGDYVMIARQDRNSDDWFVGAITDENARELTLDLSFLEKGRSYTAQIYRDGDNANWETEPYEVAIESKQVKRGDSMKMKLATSGGTAIRFKAN